MKKIILLLLLPLLCFSQTEEKSEECKIIYNNIINAIGNSNPEKPQFVFSSTTGRPAFIRNNKIYFEEKTYDALSVLGEKHKDGIAFILAHELAHHYLRHVWMKEAGYGFKDTEIGQTLINFDDRLVEETQADLYAGFFSHIAGYKSLSIADKVLDIVYNTYQLDSNSTGYPSLYERKKISESKKEQLQELTDVFNVANLALLSKNYSIASKCFTFILYEGFTSREIYNNLGITFVYQALELLDKEKYKYYFPTSLDLNTRAKIEKTRGLGIEDNILKATELLENSIERFDKAILLDNEYTNARANKSVSLMLLATLNNEYEIKFFNFIESLDNKNHLKAIYYALTENKSKAKRFFKNAIKEDEKLSTLNFEIFNSKSKEEINSKHEIMEIDNVDLNELAFMFDKPYRKINGISGVSRLKIKEFENSIVYDIGRGILIQETTNTDFTTNLELKAGSNLKNILSKFGDPSNIIISNGKNFYIYKQFIFCFVEDELIKLAIIYNN